MSIIRIAALAACASLAATITSTIAQSLPPEVQVSRAVITDFEFDWGRDGIHCASCNGGAGNARFTFVDVYDRLWVARLDPDTGAFVPANGQGTLVDVDAAQVSDFGNGPEWVSTAGGSRIAYVRYPSAGDHSATSAAMAVARFDGSTWHAGVVPDGDRRVLPFGSLDPDDAAPRLAYQHNGNRKTYVRFLDDPGSETEIPQSEQICSRRWVAGAQALIYAAPCAARSSPSKPAQVYWFDVATRTAQRVTQDNSEKSFAFAWRAPELDGDFVLLTIGNKTNILLYRRTVDGNGVASWSLYNTIAMPAATPYATSPDPFVHNGRSYVVAQASASSGGDYRVPTHIVLTGIDPAAPSLRVLTSNDAGVRIRSDPEYYITNQGPFIYYNRYLPPTSTRSGVVPDGVWRIDTGLGPPLR